MKKTIKECTFKDFSNYCNDRACDGRWSYETALIYIQVIEEVYKIKPLFGRMKAREKKWEELKKEYFDLNAEIEV